MDASTAFRDLLALTKKHIKQHYRPEQQCLPTSALCLPKQTPQPRTPSITASSTAHAESPNSPPTPQRPSAPAQRAPSSPLPSQKLSASPTPPEKAAPPKEQVKKSAKGLAPLPPSLKNFVLEKEPISAPPNLETIQAWCRSQHIEQLEEAMPELLIGLESGSEPQTPQVEELLKNLGAAIAQHFPPYQVQLAQPAQPGPASPSLWVGPTVSASQVIKTHPWQRYVEEPALKRELWQAIKNRLSP